LKAVSYVEVHNAGMPVKIVFVPWVPGGDMREKKSYCERELDWLRKLLTYEPRGSSNSYGVLVTSPVNEFAHLGAVFFDPSGWHDMCGHASMGLACYLVRSGLFKASSGKVELALDTPAGVVKLIVETGALAGRVRLVNVPSYVVSGFNVTSSKFGSVTVDLAYGGNLYGIVDLDELGVEWSLEALPELVELARELWKPVEERAKSTSSYELYGFRFSKKISSSPPRYYGILLFGSPKRVLLDRSPSGTGSSAHLAHLYHLGLVKKGEVVEFLSAINTAFLGKVLDETETAGRKAIIPEITTALRACYVTGYSTAILEPDDPLKEGFAPLPV